MRREGCAWVEGAACPGVRRAGAAVDSAASVGMERSASAAGAGASRPGRAARAADSAAAATRSAVAGRSLGQGFSSRGRAAGGLTTTAIGGGATTTAGRAAAPAGALATTGPAGGREAIAGGAFGTAMVGGAERGWGTILRGAGRAGAAAGGATAGALGGSGRAGAAGAALSLDGALTAARGAWLRRASCSAFCLAAKTALAASPTLEICERSTLGVIAWAARDAAALPWLAGRVAAARLKCARTLSASSSSSELEWVLPPARPSSANRSRTCLLLTSISRARSLIRTLLIRLFSNCATHGP